MQGEMIAAANISLVLDFEDPAATYGNAIKSSKTGKQIAFMSEDLDFGENLEPNRSMTGRRTRPAKVPGKRDLGGKLSHYATFDTAPWMWKWVLGGYGGTTNAGTSAVAGTVTLSSGKVATVPVSAGGSGYVTPPRVVFSGGTGSGAEAYAVLTADAVTSVVITKGGSYTVAPTATFTPNITHASEVGDTLYTAIAERKKPFSAASKYDLMTGIRVGNATVKISSTGFLTFDLDVKGGSSTTSGTAYDGSAVDLRFGKHIDHSMLLKPKVLLDGVATSAFIDLSLSVNNNLDGDDYPIGSAGDRGGITPDDVEIKGSGTLRVLDQATLDLINDRGDHSLSAVWVAADSAYFHGISLPAIQFDPKLARASGRGSFKCPFTFEAHDDGTGKELATTCSNARATTFNA